MKMKLVHPKDEQTFGVATLRAALSLKTFIFSLKTYLILSLAFKSG